MDEETKLYVDMLKGLSLAALITALFRDSSAVERLVLLLVGGGLLLAARWLVRRRR